MKDYSSLRIKELKTKMVLHQKIKGLGINLKLLKKTLPKIEEPEMLRKEEKPLKQIKQKKIEIKKVEKNESTGIDAELREIQEKLRSLGQG